MKVDKPGQNLTLEIRQRAGNATAQSMTEEQRKARASKGAKVLASLMTKEQLIARAKKANANRKTNIRKRERESANPL